MRARESRTGNYFLTDSTGRQITKELSYDEMNRLVARLRNQKPAPKIWDW